MKKLFVFLSLFFFLTQLQSQNYLLSFAGTGGSTSIDSIRVKNLMQGTTLLLNGSDILSLQAIVGLESIGEEVDPALSFYPNPMMGSCTIEFEVHSPGHTTIELFDFQGRMIAQSEQLLSIGSHNFSLTGLDMGVYNVMLRSENSCYTGKVVSIVSNTGDPTIIYSGFKNFLGKSIKMKNGQSGVPMQYNNGDRLLIKCYSGTYATILTVVPTQSITLTANFVDCTDVEGNHYATVSIGTQVWMAENLKTRKYRNGVIIPNVTGEQDWENQSAAAYCDYNNDSLTAYTYGRLYNWFAVNDTQQIAPIGWHVPSYPEWGVLMNGLGGAAVAGGMLKESDTLHWLSPNAGATNATGFTALPAGYRSASGYFEKTTEQGWWHAITTDNVAWGWDMRYIWGMTNYSYYDKQMGASVRCVMD